MENSQYVKETLGSEGRMRWGNFVFSHPVLQPLSIPFIDITAAVPGPKLAIVAGMHPNEVAAMEAALRLKDYFASSLEKGSVSILPVLNMPGLWIHSEYVFPADNRNMNFLSPGNPDGSYTEILLDWVLQHFAAGADLFIDLHGGDLREDVAKFVMCQMTGDAAFDDLTKAYAHQYDADVLMDFAVEQTNNRGRATNELPFLGRHAVMSEAGANGILDEESTAFHFNGVANIARFLGMTFDPPAPKKRANRTAHNSWKIETPVDGRIYLDVKAGDIVAAGQRMARMKDLFGNPLPDIVAPFRGAVIVVMTHNITVKGEWLFSLAPVEE
ncbi:MAG: succinylglutamate desuccinylase/aspartoacylase family protein [Methylobacteriaceae bacterium]|jgi:predicted deacylase|nr:succinylglutamate desuccinylase/aspartoacylase family protein [Methylobacteriaceae bacterium]